ncbi:MAG: segregation/condensation protein A, partial [Patescibacteria group bacterium]
LAAVVNIEAKMSLIQTLLKKLDKFNFSHLLSEAATRIDAVVSFLAMLELMKQRTILARQGELFAEIEILKI